MLYDREQIEANYKDFILFILTRRPTRLVSTATWIDSEVGDWMEARGMLVQQIINERGDPTGLFGPYEEDPVSGFWSFPWSEYGNQCAGCWCDITASLDVYNPLSYGHLQEYIIANNLQQMQSGLYRDRDYV